MISVLRAKAEVFRQVQKLVMQEIDEWNKCIELKSGEKIPRLASQTINELKERIIENVFA